MRESGILMPVSSLPGPYGIGCFGKEAFKFVDFLAQAGQKIWQILPLSPTGYGDSPYQSFSAFAGNPYFIDYRLLASDGWLTADEIPAERPVGPIDYGALYNERPVVLKKAADRLLASPSPAYEAFCREHSFWLEDYALYMALKTANGMKSWTEWPREYRKREPQALEAFKAENEEEIGFWKFLQYEFSIQWKKLKAYANANNVQILGDIPIYVSADSVDAWVGGALFELDADGGFARVAGCPPDYFSAEGQLWGNPLYNWEYHKKTGTTVLLVSHSMEDIAKYANRVLVMSNKKIAMYDTVEKVFARAPELLELGLSVPQVTKIFLKLREMGVDVPADVYTIPYAVKMILAAKARRDAGETLVLPRNDDQKGGAAEC